jgi:hypothetical protein
VKTVVFGFGRFNPPTIGHQLVVSKVVETARKYNADHVVFLSQTQNNKTDPLHWEFKRRVCESAFKGVNISKDKGTKNPFIAFENLKDTYQRIIMIVGSDQKEEFKKRFTPYAKEWGVSFNVVSAGSRLVESAGVTGISATKMRKYALENNKQDFIDGLPDSLSKTVKELVFENTRKALKKP